MRIVGSGPAGSDSTGTTAAAPGWRMISSSPDEPSGNYTASTSSVMTRPAEPRIKPPSVLEQPGDGDFDALGQDEPGVAARTGADRGTGSGRRERHEPFARGHDAQ